MKKKDVRICIMRVGGTNCDEETKRAFQELCVTASVVNTKELIGRENLLDYDGLVIPGGFSFGDYVRAGAIWADMILDELKDLFKAYVQEKRPVLGICNGFQVLVEAGLLPGFGGMSEKPEAALANNVPIGYRCAWVSLKHENSGRCIFTRKLPPERLLSMPIAHGEGRLVFPGEEEDNYLMRMQKNDQIVFRYTKPTGEYANGEYPHNPNGSFFDIAGICDPSGTVFGLMPHPERAFYGWQLPDWTRRSETPRYGCGRLIFESMVEYLTGEF